MKELIESAYYLYRMQELAEGGYSNMCELQRIMELQPHFYTPADFERVQDEINSSRRQIDQYNNSLQVVISKIKLS